MCPAGPERPVPALRNPAQIAAQLVGEPIVQCLPVSRSGNSRVWRVVTRSGQVFAAKVYPDPSVDTRARLAREIAALRFLTQATDWMFEVPAVIGFDVQAQVGLYSWVDGAAAGPATRTDIEQLAAATTMLKRVSASEQAWQIGEAAEATLCAATLVAQIRRREALLIAVTEDEPDLAALLAGDLADALASGQQAVEQRLGKAGLSLDENLRPDTAVLSPSDFGLHNCLRRPDGRFAFLDFEYFGWDDPVRLVTDVICHPAMALDDDLRRAFVALAMPVFDEDPTFTIRLAAMAPLIALRWALIVLNEFIPAHWRRRVEAGMSEPWAEAKARQIRKARGLIALSRSFQTVRWT